MVRKKWTAQTEVTDSLLRLREKRKWQLGFRRYVLERMPSEAYAPYFGLDIETLRTWFELQFEEGLDWENFGKAWQFEHIIPTSCFDYSNEEDLRLCWSFINLRVERIDAEETGGARMDLFSVKNYFDTLYSKTGLGICRKMIEKIEAIEAQHHKSNPALESFILENKSRFENISSLTNEEFNRLNQNNTVEELLLEREILRKFGSGQKP